MRQTAIGFYIKKLELEGVIASPSDGGAESGAAVVVCHSHPMLGGDMDDPVVSAICGASVREGLVALRFNFRGCREQPGRVQQRGSGAQRREGGAEIDAGVARRRRRARGGRGLLGRGDDHARRSQAPAGRVGSDTDRAYAGRAAKQAVRHGTSGRD